MSDHSSGSSEVPRPSMSPEEARYAAVLRWGVRGAMVLLVAAGVVYGLGVLRPGVSLDELPAYWGLGAAEYVERTGAPVGWQWLGRLGEGDILTVLPAILLASLTAAGMAAVLPQFVRRREYVHVIVIVLHVVLIVAAAAAG
jgi:hypothetical protein